MEKLCLRVHLKRCYFLIFLLALGLLSKSQGIITYSPFRDDSLALTKLSKATSLRFENDKAGISGENKKYIIEQYQERYDYLKKMYEQQEFITDAGASAYLNALMDVILQANPSVKITKPIVLFSKVYWPNASSLGEGTLVFNISLFNRLQNEAQVAFILCHELAHYYLNHSNKSILQYVNTLYSKEFQAELRDINKSEYLKGQRLKGLVKNISFKSRRHSRDHEVEADSMGLEFLKNTGYDVRESLSALALLDSVDNEKFANHLQLDKQLNFTAYPFQPRWIRAKSISLGEAMAATGKPEDKDEDSLKTHPDCTARVQFLKARAETYYTAAQKPFIVNPSYFDTLVNRFDHERIVYCYKEDEVSRALFYSLQMFTVHPNDVFLATMIGKCFNAIYDAQQQHYLGRIIDLPSGTKDKKEYDVFLQFLQSLRLNDIASINYYFLEQQQAKFNTDAAFAKELNKSKTTFSSYIKN